MALNFKGNQRGKECSPGLSSWLCVVTCVCGRGACLNYIAGSSSGSPPLVSSFCDGTAVLPPKIQEHRLQHMGAESSGHLLQSLVPTLHKDVSSASFDLYPFNSDNLLPAQQNTLLHPSTTAISPSQQHHCVLHHCARRRRTTAKALCYSRRRRSCLYFEAPVLIHGRRPYFVSTSTNDK